MSSPNIPGLVDHLLERTNEKCKLSDAHYNSWLDANTLRQFGFEVQESAPFNAYISPEKLFLEALGHVGMSVAHVTDYGVALQFEVKNHNVVGATMKRMQLEPVPPADPNPKVDLVPEARMKRDYAGLVAHLNSRAAAVADMPTAHDVVVKNRILQQFGLTIRATSSNSGRSIFVVHPKTMFELALKATGLCVNEVSSNTVYLVRAPERREAEATRNEFEMQRSSPRVAARRRAVANLKAHREGRMDWAAFVVQRDHDKSE